MVDAEDFEPQVDPEAPTGAPQETPAPQDPPPAPEATETPTPESSPEPSPASEAPTPEPDAEPPAAPEISAPEPDAAAPPAANDPAPAEGEASSPASESTPPENTPPAAGQSPPADGTSAPPADGEGAPKKKKKRRPRGRRAGHSGPGGKRRFAWDEVFLRQRLELLRAMDPDPEAITWAVHAGGRFDVADILAGEGSSGREFGRRAYAATPETDDQAAWIILAAVRARDIVPVARRAVSTTTDQREQVKAAIEHVGIARVNPALQGDKPVQQVFAERARRVDLTVAGGEEQKAAWALLSLARPQDVKTSASPPRPRTPPGGRGPGGPGGFGDDRRGRQRREPGIPGGVFSVGESGIGGELGAKLRAALAAAEADAQPEPEAPSEPETTAPVPEPVVEAETQPEPTDDAEAQPGPTEPSAPESDPSAPATDNGAPGA